MGKRIEQFRPAYLPDAKRLYQSTDKRKEANLFYASKPWREFRAWYLRAHPLCVDCQAPATEVHHEIPRLEAPLLAYVESNMQPQCHSCHLKKRKSK